MRDLSQFALSRLYAPALYRDLVKGRPLGVTRVEVWTVGYEVRARVTIPLVLALLSLGLFWLFARAWLSRSSIRVAKALKTNSAVISARVE